MRKKLISFVTILAVSAVFTACKGSDSKNDNMEVENQQETKTELIKEENITELIQEEKIIEEPFQLSIEIQDSKNAVITIWGTDHLSQVLQPKHLKGKEISEDELNWQINFEPYFMIIEDDIKKNQLRAYLGKKDNTDNTSTVFPEVKKDTDHIEIKVQLPDEDVDIHMIEQYELLLIYDHEVISVNEINLADMLSLNTSKQEDRVFPQEVYNKGFEEATGDEKYFKPLTEDYVLSQIKRNDGSMNEAFLLISFDQYGFIQGIMRRDSIISGQQAGPNGTEPVYGDDEIMRGNLESYYNRGYNDAKESGYVENSATYDGHYIYSYLSKEEALNEDMASISAADIHIGSTKEKIVVNQKPDWTEFDSSISILYISKHEITKEQKAMPQYCKEEDFFLFPYRTLSLSEDYLLSESRYNESISFSITYFDEKGDVIGSEQILYNADNTRGFVQHPDNKEVYVLASNSPSGDKKWAKWRNQERMEYFISKRYTSYDDAVNSGAEARFYSIPERQE